MMSAADDPRGLDHLPDPDDRGMAWFGDEPAFMAWWRHGLATGNGPAAALTLVLRERLFERYAHAIPTNESLDALLSLGPLLEVGAGAGYWARLLRDLDGDVVATDPARLVDNDWFLGRDPWTHVDLGGVEAIADHPGRAIFVCSPNRPNGFMNDILAVASDRAIALITNGLRGENDDLGDRLADGWDRDCEITLPTTPIPYRGDSLTLWSPRVAAS